MTTRLLAQLVLNWAVQTYGPPALDRKERSMRICEEAGELAQADGVDPQILHAIIDRTYSRPVDTAQKELGGLMVTVFGRCAVDGWDPLELLEREITRVLSKPAEHWKAKHNAKVAVGTATGESPLPGLPSVCTGEPVFNTSSVLIDAGNNGDIMKGLGLTITIEGAQGAGKTRAAQLIKPLLANANIKATITERQTPSNICMCLNSSHRRLAYTRVMVCNECGLKSPEKFQKE